MTVFQGETQPCEGYDGSNLTSVHSLHHTFGTYIVKKVPTCG